MDIYLLFGPPGSGKGTLVNHLIHKGYHCITASRLLAEEFKETIKDGNLVSDHCVNAAMEKEFLKCMNEGHERIFVDGYPRTVGQAEFVNENFLVKRLFNLTNISEEKIVARLSGRLVCSLEGHSFHEIDHPPKKLGVCDFDGSPLVKRVDDNPSVIEHRLKNFYEITAPVIDMYEGSSVMVELDGEMDAVELGLLIESKL